MRLRRGRHGRRQHAHVTRHDGAQVGCDGRQMRRRSPSLTEIAKARWQTRCGWTPEPGRRALRCPPNEQTSQTPAAARQPTMWLPAPTARRQRTIVATQQADSTRSRRRRSVVAPSARWRAAHAPQEEILARWSWAGVRRLHAPPAPAGCGLGG